MRSTFSQEPAVRRWATSNTSPTPRSTSSARRLPARRWPPPCRSWATRSGRTPPSPPPRRRSPTPWTQRGQWRGDYGSVLRDASAILALATDSKAKPEVIKTAMGAIEVERARSSYASTQDMAWMVLAARAVIDQSKAIRIDVDGKPHDGSYNRVFGAAALANDVKVQNLGAETVKAVVAVSGSPLVPEPAASNGLVIERKYFTPDGQPADPARVTQNTRLVAVLSVMKPAGDAENGNFLLVDRLPAGFEIENPTLVSSGSTSDLAWLSDTSYAPYTEFRDDRFVASFTTSTAKLAAAWCQAWHARSVSRSFSKRASDTITGPSGRAASSAVAWKASAAKAPLLSNLVTPPPSRKQPP